MAPHLPQRAWLGLACWLRGYGVTCLLCVWCRHVASRATPVAMQLFVLNASSERDRLVWAVVASSEGMAAYFLQTLTTGSAGRGLKATPQASALFKDTHGNAQVLGLGTLLRVVSSNWLQPQAPCSALCLVRGAQAELRNPCFR